MLWEKNRHRKISGRRRKDDTEIAETTEQYVDESSALYSTEKWLNQAESPVQSALQPFGRRENVKADAIIESRPIPDRQPAYFKFQAQNADLCCKPERMGDETDDGLLGITPIKGVPQSNSADIVSHSIAACRKTGNEEKDLVVVIYGRDPVTNCVEGVGHVTNMLYVIEAK